MIIMSKMTHIYIVCKYFCSFFIGSMLITEFLLGQMSEFSYTKECTKDNQHSIRQMCRACSISICYINNCKSPCPHHSRSCTRSMLAPGAIFLWGPNRIGISSLSGAINQFPRFPSFLCGNHHLLKEPPPFVSSLLQVLRRWPLILVAQHNFWHRKSINVSNTTNRIVPL